MRSLPQGDKHLSYHTTSLEEAIKMFVNEGTPFFIDNNAHCLRRLNDAVQVFNDNSGQKNKALTQSFEEATHAAITRINEDSSLSPNEKKAHIAKAIRDTHLEATTQVQANERSLGQFQKVVLTPYTIRTESDGDISVLLCTELFDKTKLYYTFSPPK